MPRLTDKTAITTIEDSDLMHVVDVSDTSSSPLGTSKKATLNQIKNFIGGDEATLGPWDAEVDNSGILPGHYVNVGAATAAGKKYINVTTACTETDHSVLAKDTYIFFSEGGSIDFGAYRIDLDALYSISFEGLHPRETQIIYTPTTNGLSLVHNGNSAAENYSQGYLRNIRYENRGTASDTPLFSSTNIDVKVYGSHIFAGNADNAGIILSGIFPYGENIIVESSGSNSTNAFNGLIAVINGLFLINAHVTGSTNFASNAGGYISDIKCAALAPATEVRIEFMGHISQLSTTGAGSVYFKASGGGGHPYYEDINLGNGTFDCNSQDNCIAESIVGVNSFITTGSDDWDFSSCEFGGTPTLNGDRNKYDRCVFSGNVSIAGDNTNLSESTFSGDITINSGSDSTVIVSSSCAGSYTNSGTGVIRAANDATIGNDYDGAHDGAYEALVGTGETYTTLQAALDAGHKRIATTSALVLSADVVFPAGTFYIFLGDVMSCGDSSFDLNSVLGTNIHMVGISGMADVIQYSPSTGHALFINDDGTQTLIFENLTFLNSGSVANTPVSENAIVKYSNCSVQAGNADNAGVNLPISDSYFVQSSVGGGASSTNAFQVITGSSAADECVVSNSFFFGGADVSVTNAKRVKFMGCHFNASNLTLASSCVDTVISGCTSEGSPTFTDNTTSSIKSGNDGTFGNDYDFVIKSTSTTPYSASINEAIKVDATSGNIVVDLPTAVGLSGKHIFIKKMDASSNTVTLDGNGTETIDNDATYVISSKNESVSIMSDGANWLI